MPNNEVYQLRLKEAFVTLKEAVADIEDIAMEQHPVDMDKLRKSKLKFNKAIIMIQNACEDAKLIEY